MKDELEGTWRKGHGLFKILSHNIPEGTEESHEAHKS
jgi:hypothetical protein